MFKIYKICALEIRESHNGHISFYVVVKLARFEKIFFNRRMDAYLMTSCNRDVHCDKDFEFRYYLTHKDSWVDDNPKRLVFISTKDIILMGDRDAVTNFGRTIYTV
ncbi:hypothetical protein ES708_09000 [subsurface metagenome]